MTPKLLVILSAGTLAFPIEGWLWVIFAALAVSISALDLFFITHRHGPVGLASSLRWTSAWIVTALSFGILVYFLHPHGATLAPLYIAGYLTEYSLSIDNLFVFILIFSLMRVPDAAQPKLIKLGIYLAIVLRIVFILFGVALVARFHWILYIFGILLIWTAWKMLVANEDDHIDPTRNFLYRAATRLLPVHDPGPENRKLVLIASGKLVVTPLFLVLLVIGSTDILFAIDSIPAILGISRDPFVVLTSNVFAVLGLNSLFFALRGIMSMFRYLKHGVSVILFFIGFKMLAGYWEPVEDWFHDNPFLSLAVIGTVLATSILVSILHKKPDAEEEQQAPGDGASEDD